MARPGFIQLNRVLILITEDNVKLRTIVQEVGPNSFTVLAPDSQERLLTPGSEVKAIYYAQDGRYEFTTRVARHISGEPPFYLLDYPRTYRRVQLRSHVRIKAALEFRYACWPAADWPHSPPVPQKRGITLDISGGGAQVVLPQALEPGSMVYLELELPGQSRLRPLALAARVERSNLLQLDGEEKYELGLAFVNISEKQEDQITAFVFQRLLQQKRRRS